MAEIGEQRTRKDSFEQSSPPSQGRPRKDSFDSTTIGRPLPVERRSSAIEEKSPNERYVRSKDIVFGNASSVLISYKAFDTNNGVEIAWHKFNLTTLDTADKERLKYCIDVGKQLDSDYLIRYLDTWCSQDNNVINIITTNLESLKEFVSKVKTLRWRIVKKWCRQFLAGLSILHNHTPAIIHRHFSFAHIYIDGGLGTTSVGDLWLAAIMIKDSGNNANQMGLSESVTKNLTLMAPTYMAPEMFENQPLTTKMDIYCLGMCVLEMLAGEEPYKECGGSQTKLRSKVLAGLPPLALQRVPYNAAKDFIAECLLPETERPSASELVKHEFLSPSAEDDDEIVLAPGKVSEYTTHREAVNIVTNSVVAMEQSAAPAVERPVLPAVANVQIPLARETEQTRSRLSSPTAPTAQAPSLSTPSSPAATSLPATAPASPSAPPAAATQQLNVSVVTPAPVLVPNVAVETVQLLALQKTSAEGSSAQYQLQINIPTALFLDGSVRVDKEVEFSFDCGSDSFAVVSAEMIEELGLQISVEALASQIENMMRPASTKKPLAQQRVEIESPVPQDPLVLPATKTIDSCAIRDNVTASIEGLDSPVSELPQLSGTLTVDVPDRTASIQGVFPAPLDASTATETPADALTTAESSDPSPGELPTDSTVDGCVCVCVAMGVSASAVHSPDAAAEQGGPLTSEDSSPLVSVTPAAESAPCNTIGVTSADSGAYSTESEPTVPAVPDQISPSSPSTEETHPALRGGGGVLLQQELEKIDQEARVARRAFENRIQKLITIQEKCQKDIVKLEAAYEEKNAELSRKEDKARTQRDVEIAKAEAAIRQKLENLLSFLIRHTPDTPVAAATISCALPGSTSESGLDHQQ